MKTSAKNMATFIILVTLIVTTATDAFAATITSVMFSPPLWYEWNGPMYFQMTASCSQLAAVDIEGVAEDPQRGPLNGTWQTRLSLSNRITYTVHVICQDTDGHGTAWVYSVWHNATRMSVKRIEVITW